VNIKMNNFVGNSLKNTFYTCFYSLISGIRSKLHLSAALLCYFVGATGVETSLLLTAFHS